LIEQGIKVAEQANAFLDATRLKGETRLTDGEDALENLQSDHMAHCYIPRMEQLHQPPMTKSA
jgi:hypothetical protein